MSIITLLTDFGTDDEYVGVMKGVILSVQPAARIVDISHAVTPQDILQAALMIDAVWAYFPKGTVHVLVVDPGVGGQRAIVALKKEGHVFLAPDNGVLTRLLETRDVAEAVLVENPAFFRHPVSATFHGRDIFAPVSAHLSSGVPLRQVGVDIAPRRLVRLPLPEPTVNRRHEISGIVLSVDRFGNLITNIRETDVQNLLAHANGRTPGIKIGDKTISGIHRSYDQRPADRAVAVIGSRGYLEIAVNRGNASRYFNVGSGDAVSIRLP